MGVTQSRTSLAIVQRFWTIDPLTEVATLADPDSVVFTVFDPDGDPTSYTFGSDGQVTNPSVGVYVLNLEPPFAAGVWRYVVVGSGNVDAEGTETFEVGQNGTVVPAGEGPIAGPCSPWITGEDIASCGPDVGVGSDTFLLDEAASNASYILWALSGRRFGGICSRKVRPCRTQCRCWNYAAGFNTWSWTLASWGANWPPFWVNEGGDKCGCGSMSVVKLAGYPVRRILQVKIDGVELPELDDDGNPNWRLDGRRNLTRMDSPVRSIGKRRWPSCQNLSLDDTETGTFSVTYDWGQEAPDLGKRAAAQLGRELFRACFTDEECQLPERVTRIQRMGITIERLQQSAEQLRQGNTGLDLVDAFIASANQGKTTRRPAVWSPDKQAFARKVG